MRWGGGGGGKGAGYLIDGKSVVPVRVGLGDAVDAHRDLLAGVAGDVDLLAHEDVDVVAVPG